MLKVIEMLAFGLAACAGEANNALAMKTSAGRPRRAQFMKDTFSRAVRAVPTQSIKLQAMITLLFETRSRPRGDCP
jgi:hypothetical protein